MTTKRKTNVAKRTIKKVATVKPVLVKSDKEFENTVREINAYNRINYLKVAAGFVLLGLAVFSLFGLLAFLPTF